MKYKKVIRDSIHGDIFLTSGEVKLIDTPEFQRLRRIKQLGMTYLVYPGANHTRFEHSIGTLFLASRVAERLNLEEEEIRLARFSALLHDIGHGPLSHTSEEILEYYLKKSHEEITVKLIKDSSIASLLEDEEISPKDVAEIILGKRGYLSEMISGDFDVDRMDFLVRDAHYTGVAYGVIDLDRLINTLTIYGNSLVVTERGLKAVEALLIARFLMTPTVYLHHTSRIADAMFLRAIEVAIKNGELEFEEFYRMDDIEVYSFLRNSRGYVRDIGLRFDNRDLFKKAWVKSWNELPQDTIKEVLKLREKVEKWRKTESEIAMDYGIDEGYVLLDIPEIPSYKVGAVMIKEGKCKKIDNVSPLIRILKEAGKTQWNIAIYSPKENVDKLKKFDLNQYI